MSSQIPNQSVDLQAETMAFGSRMEAATEALLRIRNEVVTTLDRQVVELQQIHRALAFAPPPMTIVEEAPRPVAAAMAPVAAIERPSIFDNAPRMAVVPPAPAIQPERSVQPVVTLSQRAETNVATLEEVAIQFPEATLDPMLEQATLEELNDALASAFAMVSSRSGR